MARTNERLTPFRTQDVRRGQKRRIPTRRSSKEQADLRKPSLTITERRQQQKREKELFKKIEDVSQEFLSQAKNISELDKLSNQFVRNNMSRIPEQYQKELRNISKSQAQKVINKQKEETQKLREQIKGWEKREDRYDDREKEEDDPDRRARLKGKEQYYKTLVREGEKVLRDRLAKGDILDPKQVNKFLKDKASFEQDKREAREERKIAERKAEKKELEIKEYFERPNVLSAPPSVSQIQKDLEVDSFTATQIQDVAKQSAKAQVNFVNELKNTIDKGARYDINSLKEAGLSGPEAREILERQEKTNQAFASKLPQFSKDLQNKLDTIKFQTEINPFLQKIGKAPKADLGQSFLPKDVKEVNSFRNLNPYERNVALTYSSLKNIKEQSKNTQQFLDKQKQRAVLNLLPASAIAKLSGLDLKKSVNLKNVDPKKIKNLTKLTEEEIKNISIKQDNKKINDIITNYNNFASNISAINEFEKNLNKKRIQELIDLYEAQLRKKIGFVASEFDLARKQLTGGLSYVSALATLNDALKNNKKISIKEYKDYKNSVRDVFGIKRKWANTIRNVAEAKEKYGTMKAFFQTSLSLAKFVKGSAVETWKELNRDARFLSEIVGTILRKTGQGYNALRKDFYDLGLATARRLKGLPKSERDLFFRRTKKAFKNTVKAGKDVTTFIKDNSDLIVLGLMVGIDQGFKTSRKTIQENPERAVGVLASFFVDDIIISKGTKGLKFIKKGLDLTKTKALSKINDIIKKVKKLPNIRIIGNKIFKNKKLIADAPKINFKAVPDKNFRFSIKDSAGDVRFVDNKGIKKFRRAIKQSFDFKEIEPDLIRQIGRIRRKQIKAIKKTTRADRLRAEKIKRSLAKQIKESKKTSKKAPRPKRFTFYDIRSDSKKTFSNRKDWLRAIKLQEKQVRDGVLKVPVKLESGKILSRNVKRFPEWRFTEQGVFYKGKLIPSSKTKRKLSLKNNIKIKDANGNVRYVDKNTLKQIRRRVTKSFDFDEIKPDLIEQSRRIIEAKKDQIRLSKLRNKAIRKKQKTAIRKVRSKERLSALKKRNNEKVKRVVDKSKNDIIDIKTPNKRVKIDPKKGEAKIYAIVDKPVKSSGGQVLIQKQELLVETKKLAPQKQVIKTAQQKLQDAYPVARQKYGFIQKQKIKKKTFIADRQILKSRNVSQAQKVKTALKYLSIQDIYNVFAKPIQALRRLQLSKQDLKQLSKQDLKRINKIGKLSKVQLKKLTKQKPAQDIKQVSDVKQLPKTQLDQLKKQISTLKAKAQPKKTIKKIPRPKLRFEWDKMLPKGTERLVNVLVRVKGKNREINLKTTPNRALNYITKLVDNTTARSFSLKTVGLTKQKDIKTTTTTKKFRPKKRTASKVLPFVEKTKYAIDTRGEKIGLQIGNLIKSGKNKNTRTSKKRSTKRTTKKKTSTKKSKVRSKRKRSKTKRR